MKILEVHSDFNDFLKLIKEKNPIAVFVPFLFLVPLIWGVSKLSDLNASLAIVLCFVVLAACAVIFTRFVFKSNLKTGTGAVENIFSNSHKDSRTSGRMTALRSESMNVEELVLTRLEHDLDIKLDRHVSRRIEGNSTAGKSYDFAGVSFDRENTTVVDVTHIRNSRYDENRLISLIKDIALIRAAFERDFPFRYFTVILAIAYEGIDIKDLENCLSALNECGVSGKNRVEIKTFNLH